MSSTYRWSRHRSIDRPGSGPRGSPGKFLRESPRMCLIKPPRKCLKGPLRNIPRKTRRKTRKVASILSIESPWHCSCAAAPQFVDVLRRECKPEVSAHTYYLPCQRQPVL